MKSKHTPGPWFYAPEFGAVLTTDRRGTIATLLPSGHNIDSEDIDKEQMALDGRLMSAAPELLELLEWALPQVEWFSFEDVRQSTKATMLIKKIRGDES